MILTPEEKEMELRRKPGWIHLSGRFGFYWTKKGYFFYLMGVRNEPELVMVQTPQFRLPPHLEEKLNAKDIEDLNTLLGRALSFLEDWRECGCTANVPCDRHKAFYEKRKARVQNLIDNDLWEP